MKIDRAADFDAGYGALSLWGFYEEISNDVLTIFSFCCLYI